jgi:hypothetical protein
MLIIFFDCSHTKKKSSWQAKQSIPQNTTVTFHDDRVKTREDFAPNFDDKRTGCCITTTHRLTLSFSSENFLPKPTWLLSPPTHPD